MRIFIVRHAKAKDREKFFFNNPSDYMRPLKKEGIREFKKKLKGFAKAFPELDTIVTSPYLRCTQTAYLLSRKYPQSKVVVEHCLGAEANFHDLMKWLKKIKLESIALVGHDPALSDLVSIALIGRPSSTFPMKKGGICVLDFDENFDEGTGKLIYYN